jgi:hypothetical protein
MLSDIRIKKAAAKDKPYKLADGGGLYVEIMPTGSKLWRLKYRFAGKEKRLSLGPYPAIGLAQARQNPKRIWTGIGPVIPSGSWTNATYLDWLASDFPRPGKLMS